MESRPDSRARLPDLQIAMLATDATTFERDGLYLFAKSGATTTNISCPAYTDLPIGLTFFLDNSNGSGSLTLTPASGTPTVVTTGKVYHCRIVASGSVLAVEWTAAPT